jgi:hypothetical protein
MTKTENRAAAKAYQQEKLRKIREDIYAGYVAADLDELGRLRRYLIFDSRTRMPREALMSAIDDYVELLTGDRAKLHAPHHSIGGK